ncbi:multi-component transcriptional regulator, partial [filamentous cyanobacterium CCP5]
PEEQQAAAPSPTPELSPPDPQAFQQSMQGLWGKYQDLMAQRLEALSQAVTAIQAGNLTHQLRHRAAQAAHKLAGVLGMFERDDGSAIARQLEGLLESETPEDWQQVVPLVEQLAAGMQTSPTAPAVTATAKTGCTLLISADRALAGPLLEMGQAAGQVWQAVPSIEAAEDFIHQGTPDLIVADITAAAMWSTSLEFVKGLLNKTPTVPVIALSATDSLLDRVAIAQAGIQRLLTKPVTAAQVWETASQLQRDRQLSAQILVVDDDPLIVQTLRPLLEAWGLGVVGLGGSQRFWEVLHLTRPDLLLLDVQMPEFGGIELCQAVRTDPTWQNLPVLFLTAHRDADTVQAIFRAGADDYITKPIIGPELLTRILGRLERNRLLQHHSRRDLLTGLANYPHSKQALTQMIETALGQSEAMALVVMRLHQLAAINLRHGHEAGHGILQVWGQCLRSHLGGYSLGYWGDGEFVIGLPGDGQFAQDALEPLLQMLRRQIVTLPSGERMQPDFDWSLATYPGEGQTLQTLYQGAIAKLDGGDRSA